MRSKMPEHVYAIALGSNRRHGRYGSPRNVLAAATEELATLGSVLEISAIRSTPALGPAGRGFANGAVLLATSLDPADLLDRLKDVEREFGRRGGRRWGPRILDLDILLWSGGPLAGEGLVIPHPEMRKRRFVLDPLAEIASDWRDPVSGLTVRQLHYRLRVPSPVDRYGSSA